MSDVEPTIRYTMSAGKPVVEFGGNCDRRPTPDALRRELDAFLAKVEPVYGRRAVLYVTGDFLDANAAALPPRPLLALPRELGPHPETGEMITAGIGRFGPYLKVGARFKSLPKDEDVLTVGINRAVDLLATATGSAAVEVGKHPADGKPITLKKGRFGPYVQHGSVRATLKRGTEMSAVTLDMAVALIAEKGGKAPAPKKGAAKKAAKPAADKPAAENPAKPAAKPAGGRLRKASWQAGCR